MLFDLLVYILLSLFFIHREINKGSSLKKIATVGATCSCLLLALSILPRLIEKQDVFKVTFYSENRIGNKGGLLTPDEQSNAFVCYYATGLGYFVSCMPYFGFLIKARDLGYLEMPQVQKRVPTKSEREQACLKSRDGAGPECYQFLKYFSDSSVKVMKLVFNSLTGTYRKRSCKEFDKIIHKVYRVTDQLRKPGYDVHRPSLLQGLKYSCLVDQCFISCKDFLTLNYEDNFKLAYLINMSLYLISKDPSNVEKKDKALKALIEYYTVHKNQKKISDIDWVLKDLKEAVPDEIKNTDHLTRGVLKRIHSDALVTSRYHRKLINKD